VQTNAPPGDACVQHWIGGAVVLVGVGLVDVLVDDVLARLDEVVDSVVDVVLDEVVDVGPHGSGTQVPSP